MKTDDPKKKAKASIFFVAYTKDDVKDVARRPLTFCFNGGPGSSAVWLHLGLLGPLHVPVNDDASLSPARPVLKPNPHSLLDQTDLVFVDPVNTGYSRPAEGQDKKQFHGFDEDIASVGEFIHLYTTRYARWASPRFLIGESYGTLRAAGLSGHLQLRYNMDLNGIVLVSTVLDYQTISFGDNNDLPYIVYLPTYTATAWYHKRLPSELQELDVREVVAKSQAFAVNQYAVALLKGDAMSVEERQRTINELARFTGLSPDYLDRAYLRIDAYQFAKQLLGEQRKVVGRFDTRYTGVDNHAAKDHYGYDPSESAIFGAYTAGMYEYLRNDLKVKRDVPYEILSNKVFPWNFGRFGNNYVNATGTLREAMTKSPHMKVFVASGYYDLATPCMGAAYSFNHLGLAREQHKNITLAYYPAGHMMYVHGPSLKKLKEDLTGFYKASVHE